MSTAFSFLENKFVDEIKLDEMVAIRLKTNTKQINNDSVDIKYKSSSLQQHIVYCRRTELKVCGSESRDEVFFH